MKTYTLETAGLNFKRMPLPEAAMIHPQKDYQPDYILGSSIKAPHLIKSFDFKGDFIKSLSPSYESYVEDHKNTGLNLWLDSKEAETYWLDFRGQAIVENNTITLEENCHATLIFWYENQDMVHHGFSKIQVKAHASLTLIKIQNNGDNSYFVDQNQIEVEKGGHVRVYDFQLGGQKSIVNYDSNLNGYKSQGTFKSAYVTSEERGMDLSFTVNHKGQKAGSEILGKGVMSGASKKVFRGTLNFERGAIQAVGKEEEIVLLLSDDVKSDSIPALMCSEDDVIGEHGASIGRLDENQLFYLMSRGIALEQAKFLVASAALKDLIQEIEDDKLRHQLNQALNRRLEDVV
jgi:FeS assembly protein SufD